MHRGLRHPKSSDERTSGAGIGSAVPKIIGILLAIGLLRVIARHRDRHSGPGGAWRERRHNAIAELHQQLHEEEAARGSSAKADEANVTA